MIRNRDTVAITPLNNSSLPVLSKNISMGAPFPPFTLPPNRYSTPPWILFPSYSPTAFLREPSILLFFQENWENWYVSTGGRRRSFKASKLAWEAKGEGEKKKRKSRRGEFEVGGEGNKGRKGEIAALSKETFFSFSFFRPAFVSPESTRQVAPLPPFLSPRVTRNAKGFSPLVSFHFCSPSRGMKPG